MWEKIYVFYNTVECHYNAVTFVTIFHSALRWQWQNLSQTLDSQKTSHKGELCGVFVKILKKNDRVIMAPLCTMISVISIAVGKYEDVHPVPLSQINIFYLCSSFLIFCLSFLWILSLLSIVHHAMKLSAAGLLCLLPSWTRMWSNIDWPEWVSNVKPANTRTLIKMAIYWHCQYRILLEYYYILSWVELEKIKSLQLLYY